VKLQEKERVNVQYISIYPRHESNERQACLGAPLFPTTLPCNDKGKMLDAWSKKCQSGILPSSTHATINFLSRFLFFIITPVCHGRLAGAALVLTKNGLGISSRSGSQTGGSPFSAIAFSFSAILCAKALPFGSRLRFPSSIARLPALACANSTSVRPLGAMLVPLVALIMLFLVAILLRSSAFEALDLRLDFLVGDNGTFSWETRLADNGIFESRRFGEELRSLRAMVLGCGRRSGALDRVGNAGAVTAFLAKMFGCEPCFWIGAVF